MTRGLRGSSLRTKALLTLTSVALYIVALFAYVQGERANVLRDVTTLDGLHVTEAALARAGRALSGALFVVHRNVGAPNRDWDGLAPELEEIEQTLGRLSAPRPALGERAAALRAARAALARNDAMVEIYALRAALMATAGEVDAEARALAAERTRLNARIRETYDRISRRALALAAAGLGLFGLVTLVFFTRLAAQLDTLRERAAAIVAGYRGPPLASRRRDEVGALSRAVDGMAAGLEERERRLELGLRRQVHAERMAAVGAMAAKVAHEIGNPLAIVSGAAEEARAAGGAGAAHAATILEQAARIAAIARRMTDLAGARAADGAAFDLNAAADGAAELLRYDLRLGRRPVGVELAPGLPAARGDAGTAVHIVLSLILDAVESGGMPARGVRLQTGMRDGRPYVRVEGVGPAGTARIGAVAAQAAEMGAAVEAQGESVVLWLQPATE